ncbi:HAMP domain-containing histidine kinase [Sphingomonas parva]|uniref:histidine kinase n=1 Tax=Sphingomonas parva TaxID=2555898 RepID=A0A4Y8ZTI3_9SPHN|nr:ATP-binding protein [Sphingomonas parva]TFI59338.1 HAMP domain-containing histidine kinase [Sphingomonas parva]
MDTPLLALTRRRPEALPGRSPNAAAVENMRQLIQLRWLAVIGQLVAILVAHFALRVPLPLAPLLAVVALLALVNVAFTLTLRRLWLVPGELLLALLLDMAALTAQLYLSGGATNPFLSLYLLQVVLGAILLGPAMAWLPAVVAIVCWAFLSVRHLPLRLPPAIGTVPADLRLIGEWISFSMVAILLVLFIARISRNLAAREAYVAELRQRAAEEDGIVRMGLFASGAAHELGTPLSTLSVLISDWQRDPALGANPGFREELEEAQSELRRCRQIVSNILHSAGRSRGEAMASVPARALLEDVAADWRAVHGDTPLASRTDALAGTHVVADPALRQVISSLLDNAAEESPDGIALLGEVVGDQLRISILDSGPGFSDEQLARIGTLYQSSKGPGRGLGLFLASNVARRLGGSLEAANRDDGGAVVRLLLPLASALPED